MLVPDPANRGEGQGVPFVRLNSGLVQLRDHLFVTGVVSELADAVHELGRVPPLLSDVGTQRHAELFGRSALPTEL